MGPKVYVAAPWKHKQSAQMVSNYLRSCGFEVVSRWMDFTGGDHYEHADAVMRAEAQNDIADLQQADVLLYLNSIVHLRTRVRSIHAPGRVRPAMYQ